MFLSVYKYGHKTIRGKKLNSRTLAGIYILISIFIILLLVVIKDNLAYPSYQLEAVIESKSVEFNKVKYNDFTLNTRYFKFERPSYGERFIGYLVKTNKGNFYTDYPEKRISDKLIVGQMCSFVVEDREVNRIITSVIFCNPIPKIGP